MKTQTEEVSLNNEDSGRTSSPVNEETVTVEFEGELMTELNVPSPSYKDYRLYRVNRDDGDYLVWSGGANEGSKLHGPYEEHLPSKYFTLQLSAISEKLKEDVGDIVTLDDIDVLDAGLSKNENFETQSVKFGTRLKGPANIYDDKTVTVEFEGEFLTYFSDDSLGDVVRKLYRVDRTTGDYLVWKKDSTDTPTAYETFTLSGPYSKVELHWDNIDMRQWLTMQEIKSGGDTYTLDEFETLKSLS